MRYEAILFDLDGTLINTNKLILSSFRHALDVHGLQHVTDEEILARLGEPLWKQMEKFDSTQANKMVETYRRYNLYHHDREVTAFPYVEEVMEDLATQGMRMAVVTNKYRKSAEKGLRLFRLEQYLTTAVFVEDAEPKPDPALLQLALHRMNVTPDKAIMVGDSAADIEAAKQAGVTAVGVEWSMHDIHAFAPDYVIKDVRELYAILQYEPRVKLS
ncbi:HAD-IA family hydrolase [Mechercharimyces sp. CAU 1602]|uniref:HAD-IA family hydrolase n=1 Tax=Mechercharimyces sp. CAU 1602 TaxID=2973933 RepID=UPI002161A485|nr:HAD-IA family hydrolase [Mechercharimyces sp. CAU 1602]MCS1352215.1 HAD-IA family hydrolase [Mechercharimyces sp. CAU 1602]